MSEDDEPPDDQDYSSNDDMMSDSEPIAELDERHVRNRKFTNRAPFRPTAASRVKQRMLYIN